MICATTPDVALRPPTGPFPTEVDGKPVELSNQGAAHHPGELLRQPRHLHPRRTGRRPPGRHAGDGPPPP
ncbi:MAG: hypothetical protein U5R31_10215 [Acidimicrobiia bacterium]|nr:hypothetical protein [Acidimicrobiia bacterium]